MQKRRLGRNGPEVSAIGLGCMGMSHAYGTPNDAESERTLRRAIDLGATFLDTADMYGLGENERLLGRVFKNNWDGVFLCTKFGWVDQPDGRRILDTTPKHVKEACEASLRRLNRDTIDLYYAHRVDPKLSVEETVGAMAELVHEGKVRYLGLSEASADSIRRANAVHPITALQNEYSLWTRVPETRALPITRELGIGLVAYSPLSRGFLSGTIKSIDDLPADDFRHVVPRFQDGNFQKNLELVKLVEEIADRLDATPSQVALAWVLSRGDDVIPIPGTKHVKYLEENVQALALKLDDSDLLLLESMRPSGDRYPEAAYAYVER